MICYSIKRYRRFQSALLLVLFLGSLFLQVQPVHAANFGEALMRLDVIRPGLPTTVLVVVKPVTTATITSVKIMFGYQFTISGTAGNLTTSTTGLPTTIEGESLSAWPSIGATAASDTTTTCESIQTCTVATFNSGNLTPGTLYGFYITGGVTTPGSIGQQKHTITTQATGVDVDTAKVATRIITNNQVVITGIVPPTFSISLNRNTTVYVDNPDNDLTIGAGGPNPVDIDPSGIVTSQRVQVSLATNAVHGWTAWLRSESNPPRLLSAQTTESINSQGTDAYNTCNDATTLITPGGDFYQLAVAILTDSATAGTGTVTVAPKYLCDATHGGKIAATYQQLAYANGKTDTDIISVYSRASTNAMRAAGTDYTDTWDITGAANF